MATRRDPIRPDPDAVARRYAAAKALLIRQGATPEEADKFLAVFVPEDDGDPSGSTEVVFFGRPSSKS